MKDLPPEGLARVRPAGVWEGGDGDAIRGTRDTTDGFDSPCTRFVHDLAYQSKTRRMAGF